MVIVSVRTIIAYCLIIAVLRLMGKRQLGELQPSELVTTILVSNLASLPIEDADLPIVTAMLPILIIVSLEIILSIIEIKSQKVSSVISGNPKVVIRDGTIDQSALRELRYGIDDLLEALRNKDVFDFREVAYGIIETNGTLNIYKKFDRQNLTNDVFELKNRACDRPPISVIMDGVIQTCELNNVQLSENDVINAVAKQSSAIEDIYLMQIDCEGKFITIKKGEIK
ncbi:MAG: DUF421 domain-containing protein [Oscillospiraceae bacterium]